MPQASTRKNFHSSNLIRTLSDLALVEAVEPGVAFAEKLGAWLSLDGAITLHAVHASVATTSRSQPGPTGKVTLDEEFAHLRTRLGTLDAPTESTILSSTRRSATSTPRDEPMDLATSYAPYRRYYSAHQREMEASIHPFRVKVRDVLAKTSPTFAKLAALDAVFDSSLGDHERKLFSRVPSLLEKRFEQLHQIHQQALADTPEADNPAPGTTAGAWITRFWQEFQVVLRAELDARLEPTLGLIEALNHEMAQHP
ncbi:DUF3348 family protein [Rhodoferax sp.]|uniref:DUF3348 family protein n=1 Tax=Rhodoferax sp. TaxID=50421 RepID=UPI00283BDA5F|nr:DUF3348 family protein [Rhodoferax sp.]MDR3369163.1 DUF3348 family protein [Rhodoferax sp.]